MKLKNNLIFASKCDILILECMDVVVIVTVLVLYAVKLWKGECIMLKKMLILCFLLVSISGCIFVSARAKHIKAYPDQGVASDSDTLPEQVHIYGSVVCFSGNWLGDNADWTANLYGSNATLYPTAAYEFTYNEDTFVEGDFFIPQEGGYPPYYYHESAGMFCYIDFATTHLVYE